MKLPFLFLILLTLFAFAVEPSDSESRDLTRFEKEVRLGCETTLKDSSTARQTLARSTLARLQQKIHALKASIETLTKTLEEEKPERLEADLQVARQNYERALKHYRISVSSENLGERTPASVEESLKKVRETRKKMQIYEEKLNLKKVEKTPQGSDTYQELERLVNWSDRYQGLLKRVTDCAFRNNNEGKPVHPGVMGISPKHKDEEVIEGFEYKKGSGGGFQ